MNLSSPNSCTGSSPTQMATPLRLHLLNPLPLDPVTASDPPLLINWSLQAPLRINCVPDWLGFNWHF
ncbi:hypothetical protein C1H46_038411 [Malus baccata]|uniref:Uncharacterized protein n=1 Tax=Malus baccata TaxID=106549 RepID=A0A540KPA7_MALBA|nr:hypothetical protein C1H46_038411 [Malus baccata]